MLFWMKHRKLILVQMDGNMSTLIENRERICGLMSRAQFLIQAIRDARFSENSGRVHGCMNSYDTARQEKILPRWVFDILQDRLNMKDQPNTDSAGGSVKMSSCYKQFM